MRVVFMGTPDLAASILDAVAAEHEVVGAYTRPDAVRGRGKKLVASPVKLAASRLGIPVFTPNGFSKAEDVEQLRGLAPDVVCVTAYGVILPKEVLDIPTYGCLNVHTSLLPRWRGAAPIQRAILAGDAVTGACIMRVEEGLDTGPVCLRREVEVDGASADDLTAKLAPVGGEMLLEALRLVEAGTARWEQQPAEGVTYAGKIAKGELNCSPDDTAASMVRKVSASTTAHPSRAEVAGRLLAVERAALPVDEAAHELVRGLAAGEVRFAAKRLFVGAFDGAVELLQVKPDGKKSMEARAFAGGIQGIKNTTLTWGRA